MDKPPMVIFFDEVMCEYLNHYEEKGEEIMAKDLKKYLFDFSKTYKIMILTRKKLADIAKWFSNNNLSSFIYTIKNPEF